MPHIHTMPGQHDHTVTLYIVRTDTAQPKAWLHKHKKMNILLPVGGHIELNETPWQAAAHELEEESGYKLSDLKVLQPKDRIQKLANTTLHPYPVMLNTHSITEDHFHSDIAYAFVASGEPQGNIGEDESQDVSWLTQTEMNNLSQPKILQNTQQTYNFIFDVGLKNWEQLPTSEFEL